MHCNLEWFDPGNENRGILARTHLNILKLRDKQVLERLAGRTGSTHSSIFRHTSTQSD